MSTILFNEIVFGPIKSRRLGSSLGVNLLPKHGKYCTFDCIYCECGWNQDGKNDNKFPPLEEVKEALETKLNALKGDGIEINSITFSGNGEPTLHPNFSEIVDITIDLRNKLYPEAEISVLSNATQIGKSKIKEALLKVDNAILKVDSALDNMVDLIDKPMPSYSLSNTINLLKKFEGRFILQTMFLKGNYNGQNIDCTSEENSIAWQNLVRELKPKAVMMYTIDRETPATNLKKVSVEEMEKIAMPLISEGFKIQIKG